MVYAARTGLGPNSRRTSATRTKRRFETFTAATVPDFTRALMGCSVIPTDAAAKAQFAKPWGTKEAGVRESLIGNPIMRDHVKWADWRGVSGPRADLAPLAPLGNLYGSETDRESGRYLL
jgi:hypothetical protein